MNHTLMSSSRLFVALCLAGALVACEKPTSTPQTVGQKRLPSRLPHGYGPAKAPAPRKHT